MTANQDSRPQGLTARETAELLGVEVATVYAYASRGALTRRVSPDGRRSNYDPDEVELLARKGRPRSVRRRPGAVDVVIGTTISEIGDGWIRYRDRDVLDLAGHRRFEDVAQLLWTGDLPSIVGPPRSDADVGASRRDVERLASRAAATVPRGAPATSRLAAGAAAVSARLPGTEDIARSVEAASLLVDAMVACLPVVGPPTGPGAGVAERLWTRCSALTPTRARVDALDRALVLLAEHELATSTLAVRVAASTHAGPAQVLLAGLAALSGPRHGGASVRVHRRLLLDSGASGGRISSDGSMIQSEGFGHMVHRSGDPRFAPLLSAVHAIASPTARRTIEADLAVHAAAGAPPPNVDAALGALGYVARARPGTTDAVFAVARTAGWLAHAIEEADELPLRYRGRTLYRGPR